MRLLEVNDNGEFSLTEDLVGHNLPQYAILSHTWGKDSEEVTFKDLLEHTGKSKAGYHKVRFCGEQAASDGLRYFWVDTCCIDKSNNSELSEAINSMFRWYRDAAKCYVYLSDISAREYNENYQSSQFTWESAFRRSRWFTRSWTLQELIAPTLVEFFSREGKRLGDKKSLERHIYEITGISLQALRGNPLSQFSIAERMSWAENRETMRQEDEAYSLLGIFDIHMPLIYGEGRKNAFRRLREEIDKSTVGSGFLLKSLPNAEDAPFNAYNRQYEPACLPNTRVGILQEIHAWADRNDERFVFWLNGLAGTGKSTIARTVSRRNFERGRLGASFFFSRGGGDVGHATKFVTSIALQLARNIPSLQYGISEAIRERNDVASYALSDQWRQLVLRPLSKLGGNSSPASYILVIDALDECDGDSNIRIILKLLAEARLLTTVRLRVFLTSRPEIPIRHTFYQIPEAERQDFVLHNISSDIVDHDMMVYLEYNLKLIREELHISSGWPSEQDIAALRQNASGLFIWAATACRFIHAGKRFAPDRLSIVLKTSAPMDDSIDDWSTDDSDNSPDVGYTDSPEEKLDEIYLAVLKNSIQNFTKRERKKWRSQLKEAIGAVVLLFYPLSVLSLARLLDVRGEDIMQSLNDLHSILNIPENPTQPIRLHHPSFRDFLLDKGRCGSSKFSVDEKQAHQMLADRCIRHMSTSLKQDICSVDAPDTLVTDIDSSRVERFLPPDVRYACLYWVQHLQKAGAQLYDNGQIHQFLKNYLLHWLEALGWMQKVYEGILAVMSLESITNSSDCPSLHKLICEMKRFAFHNRRSIEKTPLLTYYRALDFTPLMRVAREVFANRVPQCLKQGPEVEKNWSALLQTLEGHLDIVQAVAFSPDGKLLASGSGDNTVRLWDATTGTALQTLEGHSDSVWTVAFSPDCKLLASGSDDRTIRLWDAATGAAMQTLEGHSSWIWTVAFSPGGKLLASGGDDKTVRLWNAATGSLLQTLEGHSDMVQVVAFSPNSKLLASGSGDKIIRLWDTTIGALLQTLEGHSSWIRALAFSPDGKLLASGSGDNTIRLWDVATGAPLRMLEGHSHWIRAVAFSSDGKLLASGSEDKTVRLWDATTGAAMQTLEGHSSWVRTVAFLPDSKLLASVSEDKTVRLWDTTTGAVLQTFAVGARRASVSTPSLRQWIAHRDE